MPSAGHASCKHVCRSACTWLSTEDPLLLESCNAQAEAGEQARVIARHARPGACIAQRCHPAEYRATNEDGKHHQHRISLSCIHAEQAHRAARWRSCVGGDSLHQEHGVLSSCMHARPGCAQGPGVLELFQPPRCCRAHVAGRLAPTSSRASAISVLPPAHRRQGGDRPCRICEPGPACWAAARTKTPAPSCEHADACLGCCSPPHMHQHCMHSDSSASSARVLLTLGRQ